MGLPSTRRRIVRSLAKVAVAVVIVLGMASLPSSAAENTDYPGLPPFPPSVGWDGPRATGINEVATAKQWVRLPAMFNIAAVHQPNIRNAPRCRRLGDYEQTADYRADVFFISTGVGAPEPYGYIGPFTVHTAAFGSIPVEAEVLIGQPRDEQNHPIGFELAQSLNRFCEGRGPHAGPTEKERVNTAVDMTAPVEITITGLTVDDVDLKLQPGCHPGEQSVIKLGVPAYYSLDPDVPEEAKPSDGNLMTTQFFSILNGGLLTGTVDISPFTGCRTASGEDVSRLLTATVAGTENRVRIRSEGLKVNALACASDRSKCHPPLPGLPYPERSEN